MLWANINRNEKSDGCKDYFESFITKKSLKAETYLRDKNSQITAPVEHSTVWARFRGFWECLYSVRALFKLNSQRTYSSSQAPPRIWGAVLRRTDHPSSQISALKPHNSPRSQISKPLLGSKYGH